MRFGLNFFPSFRLKDLSTADYYDQSIRLAQRADQLGYASAKAVEHYFHEYGGHTVNPIVLLTAIAAHTRRMRPITGAVIPAFNHPIKLAGELAMLDNLSRGRLDAGFGRGFIPVEFDAFQVPMEESRERFTEGIEVIRRLWTEDRVTHAGKFHQFQNVHLMPRPVQQPHPPIWIAAVATPDSFVWAGQKGYHLMIVPFAGKLERNIDLVRMYRQAWAEAGHAGQPQIQMSVHCYVAETTKEALAGFNKPVQRYIEVFSEAVESWRGRAHGPYAGYQKVMEAIQSQTPEGMIEGKVAFVGSPNEVVDQIQEMVDAFGEVEPSMQINFGAIRDDEAFRTLELFARHVMPRFLKTGGGEGAKKVGLG